MIYKYFDVKLEFIPIQPMVQMNISTQKNTSKGNCAYAISIFLLNSGLLGLSIEGSAGREGVS